VEYINSRKRLIVERHILGNMWCLQYRVKTRLFGYTWITVAQTPVKYNMSVNNVISHLESLRRAQ